MVKGCVHDMHVCGVAEQHGKNCRHANRSRTRKPKMNTYHPRKNYDNLMKTTTQKIVTQTDQEQNRKDRRTQKRQHPDRRRLEKRRKNKKQPCSERELGFRAFGLE
jgi:hypothetical protein